MSNILFLDFENKDGFMNALPTSVARKGNVMDTLDLGAGWAYAKHTNEREFKVLGVALSYGAADAYFREDDFVAVGLAIESADTLVMHNAQYDLGCLKYLGIDYEGKTIIDTFIMAKLYDSSRMSYSLESLAQDYCGLQKDKKGLLDAALELGIITEAQHNNPGKAVYNLVYYHMDTLQAERPEVVADYANHDIVCTKALYEFFSTRVDMGLAKKYSYVQKICVDMRWRGVRVDLEKAQASVRALNVRIVDLCEKIYAKAGYELNLNSSRQLAEVLSREGVDVPRTGKGNVSVTTGFLESLTIELGQQIADVKQLIKTKEEFLTKLINMASLTNDGKYGRLYPTLNVFEAVTGRFSCSMPNLQQIPSRDEEMMKMCRGIFVPEEGEKIFALDFSNQEGRLQVHYAVLTGQDGATLMKYEFLRNPNFDVHQKVANMIGCDRKTAKTINLGLSYGMGGAKLCRSLGLPTEMVEKDGETFEVAGRQGKALIKAYKEMAPYLTGLADKCKETLLQKKQIKTLGGRYLRLDPPFIDPVTGKRKTTEYKGLNKLIQGSAADQTIECMLQADKAGIKILFPVHDELVMSGNKEDAIRLKEIMETAIKLEVPVVADGNLEGGDSWATA